MILGSILVLSGCGTTVVDISTSGVPIPTDNPTTAYGQHLMGYRYYFGVSGVPRNRKIGCEWWQKSAAQGYDRGQYFLGQCYRVGKGIPQDDTKSVYWYTKSAKQGFYLAQYYLALAYRYGRGVPQDDTKAVYWFKKSALQGYAKAQNNLGIHYISGQGIAYDYDKARYWWLKAMEQDNIYAQKNLTEHRKNKTDSTVAYSQKYPDGQTITPTGAIAQFNKNQDTKEKSNTQTDPQNPTNAKAQYKTDSTIAHSQKYPNGQTITPTGAIAQFNKNQDTKEKSNKQTDPQNPTNAKAQYELGNTYGGKQQYKQAIYWYKKSAQQGYADAQYALAIMYGNFLDDLEPDFISAFVWYDMASKNGHTDASQNRDAMVKILPQDILKFAKNISKQCYDSTYKNCSYNKKSAVFNPDAQYKLGANYAVGDGVAQNPDLAFYWLLRAAKQGHANAQYNIGVYYFEGESVAQNYKQAVYWWQKSATQGNMRAQFNLAVSYQKGQGVPQDYKQAIHWLQKSATQGYAEAQYNLGLLYFEGTATPKDYNTAISLWTQSANQNFAQAQHNLGFAYTHGIGVAQDGKQAIHWLQKSAKQGKAESQIALGAIYAQGMIGVKPHIPMAYVWIYTAHLNGLTEAQKLLDMIHPMLSNDQIKHAKSTAQRCYDSTYKQCTYIKL